MPISRGSTSKSNSPSARAPIRIPPALAEWWRDQPRLALQESPVSQLVDLTAMAPVERLLVFGPDAVGMAALVAASAGLEPTPLAVIDGNQGPLDRAGVDTIQAQPHRLPLDDACIDFAILPHLLRHWDDEYAVLTLEEVWRVLAHNGVVVMWEIAASRSGAVNAAWSLALSRNGRNPALRNFGQVGQLAYDAGFAWVQTLPLRPFLFPPGPRLTVLARKEHYTPEVIGRS
ncbi:MAG: methyltransferase domain-containing protein [Chloroflexi bacterium]|nr:methyltransferase domain-containing protein [Chloroflexota bacterium]